MKREGSINLRYSYIIIMILFKLFHSALLLFYTSFYIPASTLLFLLSLRQWIFFLYLKSITFISKNTYSSISSSTGIHWVITFVVFETCTKISNVPTNIATVRDNSLLLIYKIVASSSANLGI